jgi:hypothetical protein
MDCDQAAMLPPDTSATFLIAKSFWGFPRNVRDILLPLGLKPLCMYGMRTGEVVLVVGDGGHGGVRGYVRGTMRRRAQRAEQRALAGVVEAEHEHGDLGAAAAQPHRQLLQQAHPHAHTPRCNRY